MNLRIVLMCFLVSMSWACGSSKKKPTYYEPSIAPTTVQPVIPGGATSPSKYPTYPTVPGFAEPPRADIVATYRQENNNTRELDINQNLDVSLIDTRLGQFRLPVVPQGQTTGLVPSFPQSLKWNEALQLYETTGVVQRGNMMDNVQMTVALAPDRQSVDVSFAVTLRAGDKIASSYFQEIGATTTDPDYSLGKLVYVEDELSEAFCRRNRCRPRPCPDRGCPYPVPQPYPVPEPRPYPVPVPVPVPYPEPQPYPQPQPQPKPCPDCGEWPPPPAPTPKPCPDKPCPDKPCPDKPCPDKPCPDKPCPDKPCPDKPCGNCDDGSQEGQVKVFVYKFLKID